MHADMLTHICMHIHTHICVYMYMYMCTCICTCMFVYTMYVRMQLCMCVCLYVGVLFMLCNCILQACDSIWWKQCRIFGVVIFVFPYVKTLRSMSYTSDWDFETALNSVYNTMYVCVCPYVCVCVCAYVCMHVLTYLGTSLWMYVCVCACARA